MAQKSIDFNELFKQFRDTIENLTRLNIIITGKTGVGKSTLINNIFRDRLAATGIGKPVTQSTRRLEKEGVPLVVYDTKGIELGQDVQQDLKQEIFDVINQGLAKQDINEAIHCMLYCINTTSNRIEDLEIQWLKDFTDANKVTKVPVIVVLTQAVSKKNALEMRRIIDRENLDILQIVPVLAEPYEIDEEVVIPPYGLDDLVGVMQQCLSEELQTTLNNIQITSIQRKMKYARKIVLGAASAAAAAGATPIPFSDAAVLAPIQIGMIAKITAVFGLEVSTSMITGIISSLAGAAGATYAGRAIVSNLLKMIPGGGSLAGGAISATTAAAMTTALGEAYIRVMGLVAKGEISEDQLTGETLADLLKKYMNL